MSFCLLSTANLKPSNASPIFLNTQKVPEKQTTQDLCCLKILLCSSLVLKMLTHLLPRFQNELFHFVLDNSKLGRVAQLVGHLTRKSEVLGSIPGLATYFRFSFC